MHSPREFRRRIHSISNTEQITRAMQMVAASKLRKAQSGHCRPSVYASPLSHSARSDDAPGRLHPPLLEKREVKKRAVILIAAGSRLLRSARQRPLPAGRAARSHGYRLHHSREKGRAVRRPPTSPVGCRVRIHRQPTVSRGKAMAACARDLFLKREVDQVEVLVHALDQHPHAATALPGLSSGRRGVWRSGHAASRKRKAAVPRSYSTPVLGLCWAIYSPIISTFYIYQVLLDRQGRRAERPHGFDEERDG